MNKERRKEITAAWDARNPDNARQRRLTRMKRERQAPGQHTAAQWRARLTDYGHRCAYCQTPLAGRHRTKDHLRPLSRGGSQNPDNLVPACRSCNSRKKDRTADEFIAALRVESPEALPCIHPRLWTEIGSAETRPPA